MKLGNPKTWTRKPTQAMFSQTYPLPSIPPSKTLKNEPEIIYVFFFPSRSAITLKNGSSRNYKRKQPEEKQGLGKKRNQETRRRDPVGIRLEQEKGRD